MFLQLPAGSAARLPFRHDQSSFSHRARQLCGVGLAGSPGELAGHQDAQALTCCSEQWCGGNSQATLNLNTLTRQAARQPNPVSHPHPFPTPASLCLGHGFHQGNSYLLLKTHLRVQTSLTGSTAFDNAFCSDGFVERAPQLLSCFTAACKPAMHPALDMQRQEAHPGSRAAVAGSRRGLSVNTQKPLRPSYDGALHRGVHS